MSLNERHHPMKNNTAALIVALIVLSPALLVSAYLQARFIVALFGL